MYKYIRPEDKKTRTDASILSGIGSGILKELEDQIEESRYGR